MTAGDLDAPRVPTPRPGPPRWLKDTLLVILVAMLTFSPVPGEHYVGPSPLALIAAALAAVAVVVRRRWPIPALVATFVLFGVVAIVDVLIVGLVAACAITTFNVANHERRRTAQIATVSAVLAMVGLCLASRPESGLDPRVFLFAFVIAFAGATGDGARSRREYLLALTERAAWAERTKESEVNRRVSDERLRIARDLHDTVAHQIAVINLNAGAASAALDARPERAREALATIRSASRAVLGEIGDLLAVLRQGDEPETAPAPGLGDVDVLVAGFTTAGLRASLDVTGDPAHVTGTIATVTYRVIQEGLTNAHKHGSGTAAVTVTIDERLRVIVRNPRGRQDLPGTRLGLIGLRERVASVRGTISAGPDGADWVLSATIPLRTEDT